MKRIESIQVLRGVAALMVTVFHCKDVVSAGEPFKSELDFIFNAGPAGVACFFVISGFIMVYITPRDQYSPLAIYQFIVKRITRIWPTYALLTCAFFVIQARIASGSISFGNLFKSLLFIPLSNADAPFYGYATLPVGWSLNYEICFYLLIAVSLFFGKMRWWVFFGLLAVTLIGIPLAFGDFGLRPGRPADYSIAYLNMITNPVMWNFAYGVVLGLLYQNASTFAFLSRIFLSKTAAFGVMALVVWQYLAGFFAGHGPLQWGIGAFLFLTAFIFYHGNRRTKFPELLTGLGDISFSIYLVHLPVLASIPLVFNKMGFPVFGSGLAMLLLTITVTLILASLSHTFLEQRLSEFVKNLFPAMKKKPVPKPSVVRTI